MKTSALAGCEMLCVPSSAESFGGVYTEAWALGRPVIGGSIPSIASVIEDGRTGLLSSQDPGALTERICWLLRSTTRGNEIGAAGRRLVADRYTWERLSTETLEIYRKQYNPL